MVSDIVFRIATPSDAADVAQLVNKDDKQRASMRERKKMKDMTKPHLAVDEDFDVVDYVAHPRSGQWVFAKDGKSYWNRATPKDMRK